MRPTIPSWAAAVIAIQETVRELAGNRHLQLVLLVCFNLATHQAYAKVLADNRF